jgi:5-deoxy-D-glucuronate isomerase
VLVEAPTFVLYVPAPQLVQLVAAESPVAMLQVPARQPTQVFVEAPTVVL